MLFTTPGTRRRLRLRRILKAAKNFIGDCVRRLKGNDYPLISEHL